MLCPDCKSAVCRRSRRRGVRDRILSVFGFLPWRCGTCESRFMARKVALRFLYTVHCANCGDLDPERLGRERVFGGWWNGIQRILRVPAYRCEACRNRFFSLRLFRPVQPTSFVEFGGVPVAASLPTEPVAPSSEQPAAAAEPTAALDDSAGHGL